MLKTHIRKICKYIMILFLITTATFACAKEMTPFRMVKTGYDQINSRKWAGVSDPDEVGTAPPALVALWYTPKFIRAKTKDAKCWSSGKEGIGPVWYDGQDPGNLEHLDVKIINTTPRLQTIRASFSTYNQPTVREFIFKRASGWRIDDVLDSKGRSFYAIMMKGCSS
jgi:hypothetical protein